MSETGETTQGTKEAPVADDRLLRRDVCALRDEREVCAENIRALRVGHGANCSSVGSVIDTLFVSAAVGGAIFAAVLAAMKTEKITVVGKPRTSEEPESAERRAIEERESTADANDEGDDRDRPL